MNKLKVFLKEAILTVGLAICISLILQAFIVEARVIPTGSMLPTIQINQRVLVNKFIYKIRQPERGEVIVFSPPFNTPDNKDYIKRVIGIPGDKIEIKNGIVFVNDIPLKETYLNEQPEYELGPILVPKNSLFVLGDNRNKSYDSHVWDQWLTMENVKGKAFFTYWPFNRLGILDMEVKRADISN